MLNEPWIAAIKNMVTPRWRRLYNSGKNFLLRRVKGPMLSMTCNNKTARVEVDRIRRVSKVTCGLKIRLREIKMTR